MNARCQSVVLVNTLLARQHGVITRSQLIDLGVPPTTITRLVRSRGLHRIERGVFALLPHGSLPDLSRWTAASCAIGPGGGIGATSAARLLRIWRSTESTTEVITRTTGRTLDHATILTTRTLTARHLMIRNGIKVTTPERTVLDLCRAHSPHRVAHAVHEALFRRQVTLRRLDALHDSLPRHRERTVLRRVIDLVRSGSAGTRSCAEDSFLVALHDVGSSEPVVNTHISIGGRSWELDFAWPDAGLVVEVDGPGHDRPHTRRNDAALDAACREAGLRIIRARAWELDAVAGIVEQLVPSRAAWMGYS